MSLRVWLPLDGTLDNQGLDDTIVVNNGATVDNSGKIGKCYNFNGSSYLTASLPNLSSYSTTACSMAVWIKVPNPSSGNKQILNIGTSSGWANIRFGLLYRTNSSEVITNISNGTNYVAYSCNASIVPETWVHVATVYQNKHLKIYINGQLKKTFITTYDISFNGITKLGIGAAPNGNEKYTGYLNDVRIYDHALSPMEVKQISQGLILHYLLNAKNLFNYHTTTYAKSFAPSGNIKNTSGWAISDYIPIFPNQSYLGIGLSAGGSNTYAVLYDINKNKTRTILEVANQNLIVNSNQNEYYIRLSIRDFNHELTTTAKFLENNNIQYDTSGYKNNGIKTGNFEYDSDTPKYNISAIFNGVDNCIQIGNLYSIFSNPFSINLWFKKEVIGSKKYETLIGGASGFEMDTRNGASQTLSLYMTSTRGGNAYSPFEFNNWYMVTMVNNGTHELYYINGILTKTIKKKNMPNSNYYIGAWNTPTQQNFKGNMSDFRIYCTALSAEDVLSLYNNSAYIDNQGNIYGAIYEEV